KRQTTTLFRVPDLIGVPSNLIGLREKDCSIFLREGRRIMAVVDVHRFAESITCHAWSPDHSMVAFCPNNNVVHIYKSSQDHWERLHVLEKHDQIVSGIDWSSKSNKIVTVSHDRNSYVWSLEGENKFAVGSGAKTVCICYYEQENNWWVSKLIRKRHESSVTNVAWHPNNILLATTSTDGKCRVFSTFVKGVDTKDSKAGSPAESKFGEQQILQLDLSYSWAFGVKWSPSGNTLAYVGHSSMIYFVDDVLFISEKMVIGAGYDSNPMVFAADDTGIWSFIRYIGEKKAESSSASYSSQFSEAFTKFYGQSKATTANEASESSKSRGGVHDNCINSIVSLSKAGSPKVMRLSTSGLDGKIAIWELENMQEELGHQF
uniref:Arp2/3 complex 41 kDa subunit n=1 Tax=Brassica oleracea var. oleracea TaxID=109376 RepID=A0A0D3C391_BRAOL